MQVAGQSFTWGIGSWIALGVVLLVIVLAVIGKMEQLEAGIFAALGIAVILR